MICAGENAKSSWKYCYNVSFGAYLDCRLIDKLVILRLNSNRYVEMNKYKISIVIIVSRAGTGRFYGDTVRTLN